MRLLIPPLAVVTIWGCCLAHFRTDAQALYRPSRELGEAEKTFRSLSGADAEGAGLLVVRGDSLESALETEESLPLPDSQPRLSRFLPSLARRNADARLVRALYAAEAAPFAKRLGLAAAPEPPGQPRAWRADELPPMLASSFLIREGARAWTLVPNASLKGAPPPDAFFYAPAKMLSALLERYSRTALRLLALVSGLLALLLAAFYRKRAALMAAPSLFAVAAVFAAQGLTGRPVTLFHLLACFMLIGMSLDYTVFFAADPLHAQKPVLASLLTSQAGFGALAFVSFPLLSAIGETLGLGLAVAFVAAYALFPPRAGTARRLQNAADTPLADCGKSEPPVSPQSAIRNPQAGATEQGASAVGLEAAWIAYRVFGKRAADALGRAIAACIWISNATVRRNAGTFRRLAAFTQSLVDKLVVMARGRGQPNVAMRDGADGRAFIADVAARKGLFVISSHLGCIEMLAGLAGHGVAFHAFMEVERTAVFNAFYARRARRPEVRIHPIDGFGMAEFFESCGWLDSGDCVLMAGDRGAGRSVRLPFRGGEAEFPEGAFRLAARAGHPVWFAVCIRSARGEYRALARRAWPGGEGAEWRALMRQYADFLAPLVEQYPEQWFNWGSS